MIECRYNTYHLCTKRKYVKCDKFFCRQEKCMFIKATTFAEERITKEEYYYDL